jgi:hypothetical protein
MKPILFQTDMVKAILEGRKTQTRRIVKPQPAGAHTVLDCEDNIWYFMCGHIDKHALTDWTEAVICPHRVGDILWVRETWSKDTNSDYVYRTNYGDSEDDSFPASTFKWHPSIHMPRLAARIFLKVTDVRVERLNDITEKDAIKEGFINTFGFIHSPDNVYDPPPTTARSKFITDFCRIYAKNELDTYNNPWVWVIEFERTELK